MAMVGERSAAGVVGHRLGEAVAVLLTRIFGEAPRSFSAFLTGSHCPSLTSFMGFRASRPRQVSTMPLKCLKGHVHGRSRSLEPREPPSAAELIVTMPIVRRVSVLLLLPAAGIGRELMSGVESGVGGYERGWVYRDWTCETETATGRMENPLSNAGGSWRRRVHHSYEAAGLEFAIPSSRLDRDDCNDCHGDD